MIGAVVRGEIQLRRRPGYERGRCSVFASGMSQGLRLDGQKHPCAELVDTGQSDRLQTGCVLQRDLFLANTEMTQ